MTRTFTDDSELCAVSRHARPVQADPLVQCGGGVPQPTWPTCPTRATWQVDGYQHPYCLKHAAARLRAKAVADQLRLEADEYRNAALHWETR